MNVELPDTGCNIINSSTSFYNYSPDATTRETYIIYEGRAIKQSSTYNQFGYTYSGDCLTTGDLVYNPQSEVYFTHLAVFCLVSVFGIAAQLFFRRWWRVMK